MTPKNNDYPSEASMEIAEQQLLAQTLFTSMGEGAIATDEFGKITLINPMALRTLGFTEREMIGAWFPKKLIAFREDDTPISLIDRPITKAFLTGKTITERTYYRKKNGQKFPVSITVAPILLHGKPIGAIEVFRDITLELEVDRMKSDFISLASHQLRTPLSAVKTYAHMLVEGYMGDVSPAQRKSLLTIISGANRMNELISTLLNVTRIESGSVLVTLRTINIEKLAEEVNKEHALAAADKGIVLGLTREGKGPLNLRTDSLILKEVLSNLVSNALKYTPDGGAVTIHIKPRRSDVIFTVRDSGLGIPKYSQDRVFTKFFRAHNVVKQETSGTGLGLYLVKGLLEAIDGKIWFESQEQKGTTFFVTVPKHITDSTKSAVEQGVVRAPRL